MFGVVVDSSVWIDFLSPYQNETQHVKKMVQLAFNKEILLCPTVYQEVLQGVREKKRFDQVKYILHRFPMLAASFPYIEDIAIDLYRSLRMKGITIRKPNDCLIAAYAIYYNVPVLSNDHDFELMFQHTALQKY
ncbi:MAG: PIN domain-containing protein [Spirochaetales bacterium]|nr:PIN domain-containing protein [Spirochaetales bacterium]